MGSRSLCLLGVVDNDETATERRTDQPSSSFFAFCPPTSSSHCSRGKVGGLGNMVKHETTLFKWEKKRKNFTDNKKSDYYVPQQEEKKSK